MTHQAELRPVRTIEDVLPDELLVQVFKWLPLEHLAISASRVCVRWEEAGRDALLWRRSVVDLRQLRDLRELRQTCSGDLWLEMRRDCDKESWLQRRVLELAPCLQGLRMDCSAVPGRSLAQLLRAAPADTRDLQVTRVSKDSLAAVLALLLARARDWVRSLTLTRRPELVSLSPDVVQRFWDIVDSAPRLERLVLPVPPLFQSLAPIRFRGPRLRVIIAWPADDHLGCSGYYSASEDRVWRDGALSGTLGALIAAHATTLEEVCLPWISDMEQRAAVNAALSGCAGLRVLGVPCQRELIVPVRLLHRDAENNDASLRRRPSPLVVGSLQELRVLGTALDTRSDVEAFAKTLVTGLSSPVGGRLREVQLANLRTGVHDAVFSALGGCSGPVATLHVLHLEGCDPVPAAWLAHFRSLARLTLSRTALKDVQLGDVAALAPSLREVRLEDSPCTRDANYCVASFAELLRGSKRPQDGVLSVWASKCTCRPSWGEDDKMDDAEDSEDADFEYLEPDGNSSGSSEEGMIWSREDLSDSDDSDW